MHLCSVCSMRRCVHFYGRILIYAVSPTQHAATRRFINRVEPQRGEAHDWLRLRAACVAENKTSSICELEERREASSAAEYLYRVRTRDVDSTQQPTCDVCAAQTRVDRVATADKKSFPMLESAFYFEWRPRVLCVNHCSFNGFNCVLAEADAIESCNVRLLFDEAQVHAIVDIVRFADPIAVRHSARFDNPASLICEVEKCDLLFRADAAR